MASTRMGPLRVGVGHDPDGNVGPKVGVGPGSAGYYRLPDGHRTELSLEFGIPLPGGRDVGVELASSYTTHRAVDLPPIPSSRGSYQVRGTEISSVTEVAGGYFSSSSERTRLDLHNPEAGRTIDLQVEPGLMGNAVERRLPGSDHRGDLDFEGGDLDRLVGYVDERLMGSAGVGEGTQHVSALVTRSRLDSGDDVIQGYLYPHDGEGNARYGGRVARLYDDGLVREVPADTRGELPTALERLDDAPAITLGAEGASAAPPTPAERAAAAGSGALARGWAARAGLEDGWQELIVDAAHRAGTSHLGAAGEASWTGHLGAGAQAYAAREIADWAVGSPDGTVDELVSIGAYAAAQGGLAAGVELATGGGAPGAAFGQAFNATSLANTAGMHFGAQAGDYAADKLGVEPRNELAGLTSEVGTVTGGVIGQSLIPMPGVGAAIGSAVGSVVGSVAGDFVSSVLGLGSSSSSKPRPPQAEAIARFDPTVPELEVRTKTRRGGDSEPLVDALEAAQDFLGHLESAVGGRWLSPAEPLYVQAGYKGEDAYLGFGGEDLYGQTPVFVAGIPFGGEIKFEGYPPQNVDGHNYRVLSSSEEWSSVPLPGGGGGFNSMFGSSGDSEYYVVVRSLFGGLVSRPLVETSWPWQAGEPVDPDDLYDALVLGLVDRFKLEGGDVAVKRALLHSDASDVESLVDDVNDAIKLGQKDPDLLDDEALADYQAERERLGMDEPHPEERVSKLAMQMEREGVPELAQRPLEELTLELSLDRRLTVSHPEAGFVTTEDVIDPYDPVPMFYPGDDEEGWSLAALIEHLDVRPADEPVHAGERLEALSPEPGVVAGALNEANTLVGDEESREILGGLHDDFLLAGGNDTVVDGVAGDNYLQGAAGTDTLRGGIGDDVLLAGDHGDWLSGLSGGNVLQDGSGDDRLLGGRETDLLVADSGDNHLSAGDGASVLAAVGGDNTLLGARGGENLYALAGGRNTVLGGEGMDVVHVAGGAADYVVRVHDDGGVLLDGSIHGYGRHRLHGVDELVFDARSAEELAAVEQLRLQLREAGADVREVRGGSGSDGSNSVMRAVLLGGVSALALEQALADSAPALHDRLLGRSAGATDPGDGAGGGAGADRAGEYTPLGVDLPGPEVAAMSAAHGVSASAGRAVGETATFADGNTSPTAVTWQEAVAAIDVSAEAHAPPPLQAAWRQETAPAKADAEAQNEAEADTGADPGEGLPGEPSPVAEPSAPEAPARPGVQPMPSQPSMPALRLVDLDPYHAGPSDGADVRIPFHWPGPLQAHTALEDVYLRVAGLPPEAGFNTGNELPDGSWLVPGRTAADTYLMLEGIDASYGIERLAGMEVSVRVEGWDDPRIDLRGWVPAEVYGGSGDQIIVMDRMDGSRVLGGSGFDVVKLAGDPGQEVAVAAHGVEGVIGTVGDDRLLHTGTREVALHGWGGDNVLVGGHGDDVLIGGTGDDVFEALGGRNTIVLGAQHDERPEAVRPAGDGNQVLFQGREAVHFDLRRTEGIREAVGGRGDTHFVTAGEQEWIDGGPGGHNVIEMVGRYDDFHVQYFQDHQAARVIQRDDLNETWVQANEVRFTHDEHTLRLDDRPSDIHVRSGYLATGGFEEGHFNPDALFSGVSSIEPDAEFRVEGLASPHGTVEETGTNHYRFTLDEEHAEEEGFVPVVDYVVSDGLGAEVTISRPVATLWNDVWDEFDEDDPSGQDPPVNYEFDALLKEPVAPEEQFTPDEEARALAARLASRAAALPPVLDGPGSGPESDEHLWLGTSAGLVDAALESG